MSDWAKDDFNSVRLIGRATRDFETRFTSTGVAISTGAIATGGAKKQEGTKWPTEFFDLKAFGREGDLGEALADVRKGDTVVIKKGRLVQEQWKDKETGKPRSRVVVKVEEMEILGKKGQDGLDF